MSNKHRLINCPHCGHVGFFTSVQGRIIDFISSNPGTTARAIYNAVYDHKPAEVGSVQQLIYRMNRKLKNTGWKIYTERFGDRRIAHYFLKENHDDQK